MSWVAVGIGGASLVGSLGGAAISASQQPDEIGSHQLQAQFFDPNSDPLLAALSMSANTGLGYFDPNIYMQASPANQLLSNLGLTGQVDRRRFENFRASIGSLASGEPLLKVWEMLNDPSVTDTEIKDFMREHGIDKRAKADLDHLERLITSEGYGSLSEFIDAERAYRAKGDAIRAQYEPVAEQMRAGLLASQGRTANYLQNLPSLLTGEANPFVNQLQQEALAQSQKYGTNPHAFLETARSTALNRALALIGAEQALVGNQQSQALPIAGLRSQQQVTAGQIGAAQAQSLAQMLMFNNQQQAQQANQLGGAFSNALNGALATGLIGYDIAQGPAADTRR